MIDQAQNGQTTGDALDDDESSEVLKGDISLLNPQQRRAIQALLGEPTIAKAAQRVGVADVTIYKWLEQPTFARAFRTARREVFGHAVTLTQRYAPLAVNTLAKLMTDEQVSPSVRVNAAAALLKFGREGIEIDDLAARIDALEQATKGPEAYRQLNGSAA